MTDHSEFEHILKRKERQRRVAKERHERLSYECRTIKSAIEILAEQKRNEGS